MKVKDMLRRGTNSKFRYFVIFFTFCACIHRSMANALFNAIFSVLRFVSNSRIDINVLALPLVWMDEFKTHKKELVRCNSKGTACGPYFIDQEAQQVESICLPDIYYYLLEGARISQDSSSVIIHDKETIIERASGPDQDAFDFTTGHIVAYDDDMAVVRFGKTEGIKKGIFLGGNGSSNYYHWMVEILAKLEFLSALPEQYQKFPLLVSESVLGTPSFMYTVDLFAKGRELVFLNKKSSYVVDELIYINSPNNLPFNLFGERKFKTSYVSIDIRSINFIREIALQDALELPNLSSYSKKIFLCRKGEIRNFNQDEVFDYLASFGFVKVFLEDLSFPEQVRTVYNADFIVGPTGAAWTNLIFCRPGAKCLCWMAAEYNNFSAYSTIARLIGVDLRYFPYEAGVHSTRQLYRKDYHVDLSMIEKGLATLDKTLESVQ